MESQVWRDGRQRLEAAEGTRRREPAAETDVCQFEPGTCGAQGDCRKKVVKPEQRRELAKFAVAEHGLSERQACKILNLSRSVYHYQAQKPDDSQIAQELLQLADCYPRWGYRKMIDYLRNQGYGWNHKRIYRVYCDLALNLKRKPKKRLPARAAQELAQPTQANQSWSLDFMSDSLANGKAFRTLNILDDFNREALWIEVDSSLPAERVIRVLEMVMLWRGKPKQIRMDNGPELISHRLEEWAQEHHIELAHIQPGKPAQNAYIERFNRTFREEVLDAYVFSSLEEVRHVVEAWLETYNAIRPHESLQGLSPYQFAIQHA